jgi:hypothetical protein
VHSRRALLEALGTAGIVSLAGCSETQDGNTGANLEDSSPAEAVVENYYTAVADGNLEEAAGFLALTELEEEGGTVEQVAEYLRERGMNESGTDAAIGEFDELTVSEFADYTFRTEDGETSDVSEEEAREFTTIGGDFGADEDQLELVRHTGGFVPEIWVPYQPTQETFRSEYPDGWGEVIIEVGTFDGEPLIIGDFRTFTDLTVTEE